MLCDYRLEKKWSAVGFCAGAIAGLVAITPASGFVGARKSYRLRSLFRVCNDVTLQPLLCCSVLLLVLSVTSLPSSSSCSTTMMLSM